MKHQRMDSAVDELKTKLNVPPEFAEKKAREILMEMESSDPQLIMNENGNELGVGVQNEMMQNPMMNPMFIANQLEMVQRQMAMIEAAMTTMGNSAGAPEQFGNGMCSGH